MRYRILLLGAVLALFWVQVWGQQKDNLYDGLLVGLQRGVSPESFAQGLAARTGNKAMLNPARKISDGLNAWLFEVTTAPESDAFLLAEVRRQPEVVAAQFNFRVELRGVEKPESAISSIFDQYNGPDPAPKSAAHLPNLPNDPFFQSQWHLLNGNLPGADLAATEAWDLTTGGLTPAGDTIVICVIDNGFDLAHADFGENRWVNRAEIPGDGLDNDGNGYVDDFRGWNFQAHNDNLAGVGIGTNHGTAVAGIVGARGNNNIGVAGVNWAVKIMVLVCPGDVAGVLEAYDYAWKMRRRYDQSNGTSGAFVVATNASWGINYGQPSDAPLWCAAYDTLGHAGILNVAATANADLNVDLEGDLPTACPSDFLITVTSLNSSDLHAPASAWGKQSIDLGAYGVDVFTTRAGNGYGPETGTSFAAPQVAGAIGLLYSAPCPNLVSIAKVNPAAAADIARDLILENVEPTAALADITRSGGKLDLHNLLKKYTDGCSQCPAPFALQMDAATDSTLLLSWSEMPDYQRIDLRYRLPDMGLNWSLLTDVSSPFLFEDLPACAAFQISLRAECAAETSAWSQPVTFTTDGCCKAPEAIWQVPQGGDSITLTWNPLTAANSYVLKIREKNSSADWQVFQCPIHAFSPTNLALCTWYEAQVQTLCDTGATVFSPSFYFKSPGCGACTDFSYCQAGSQNALQEWIAGVQIGTWQNSSAGGPGYENFALDNVAVEPLVLLPNASCGITLTPGFYGGTTSKEYFRVFVDYNLDGDFDDADELACDPGFAHNGPIVMTMQTPDFQEEGTARLRVVMKPYHNLSTPPEACDNLDFGQVEDYCVQLSLASTQAVQQEAGILPLRIFPVPAQNVAWLALDFAEESGLARLEIFDLAGQMVQRRDFQANARSNEMLQLDLVALADGLYFLKVEMGGRIFRGKIFKV